ncbi:MAG: hypothetical protein GVY04_04640 [Cyanobacteria bacterium]|nr:hypothetical protein [Cyanobacteria bacterium GSL.Bin1]
MATAMTGYRIPSHYTDSASPEKVEILAGQIVVCSLLNQKRYNDLEPWLEKEPVWRCRSRF